MTARTGTIDGHLHREYPPGASRQTPANSAAVTPVDTPVDAVAHPELISPRSTLDLQRRAGNTAVVNLIGREGLSSRRGPLDSTSRRISARVKATVQRDVLDPADDKEGYTKGRKKNVANSGTTRVEVTGLTYGLKGGYQNSYETREGPVGSNESSKTKESPNNTAVVIMPDTIDLAVPMQVILHFHGWGFREGDPYAGYAVATGKPKGKVAQHTVRDVDQEHWEQQIGAVSKERAKDPKNPKSISGPQIVAILAQGRGKSEFGEVPTFDYVRDVFSKVSELEKVTQYTIILSAHSGGGETQIAKKVKAGDVHGGDRSKLPTPAPKKAGAQPSDLIVLFDAEGMSKVMGWIETEIARLATATRAPASSTQAQAAIAAAPKFRGYFATKGSYWAPFHSASVRLDTALKGVAAAWRDADPADPKAVKVRDLYRFIEVSAADPKVGVGHEQVISGDPGGPAEAGSLADALRASLDPTIDRPRSYNPVTGAPRLKQWQADVAKWKAAKALKDAADKAAKEKKAQDAAAKKAADKDAPVKNAPAPTKPDVQRYGSTPMVQRDDPTTVPPKPAPPPTPKSTWKKSDATSEYALTAADKALLAGKTPDQRDADRASLDATALARLKVLIKAEKRKRLQPGEDKELADLRKLKDLVETTQRALKRNDVEDVVAAAGQGTVAQWFGAVQKGTFLGIPLRAHQSLADRLTKAEAALVADPKVNPGKADAAALGVALKMYASTSDLRQPAKAVGGSSLSMHTFGLAVDLNYKGNPFIGNAGPLAPAVIFRATSLVTGTATNVNTGLGDAQASFTALKAASDALKTYLSYRETANLPALTAQVTGHTAAKGEPTDIAGWLKQIKQDHTDLNKGGDFDKHKPPEEGFIDLNESVVLALTAAGLTWGGTYGGDKDIMHFDLRESVGAKIDAARAAHVNHR